MTCPILFLLCPRRNEFLCKLLIINDDTWAQVPFFAHFYPNFSLSTFRYVLGDTLCLIWKHVNQMGENFWVFPYFVPDCNLNSLEIFEREYEVFAFLLIEKLFLLLFFLWFISIYTSYYFMNTQNTFLYVLVHFSTFW